MNFYKVVFNDNGKYSSAVVDDNRNSMIPSVVAVQYRIGKWAKPIILNSKLFCYKSKRAAKEFVNACKSFSHPEGRQTFKIFECKVKNPKVTKDAVSGLPIPGHMFFYWNVSADANSMGLVPIGYRTRFVGVHVRADAIKLMKEV